MWVSNDRELGTVINKYFESLFSSDCNENFGNIIDKIPMCITSKMRDYLDCPVLDKEIIDAFSQMGPKKAPEIDSL